MTLKGHGYFFHFFAIFFKKIAFSLYILYEGLKLGGKKMLDNVEFNRLNDFFQGNI